MEELLCSQNGVKEDSTLQNIVDEALKVVDGNVNSHFERQNPINLEQVVSEIFSDLETSEFPEVVPEFNFKSKFGHFSPEPCSSSILGNQQRILLTSGSITLPDGSRVILSQDSVIVPLKDINQYRDECHCHGFRNPQLPVQDQAAYSSGMYNDFLDLCNGFLVHEKEKKRNKSNIRLPFPEKKGKSHKNPLNY